MNLHELDFNPESAAAFEALENSNEHIFVTGKAGTGKSTLLNYFRQRTQKDIAVLAPTGVAAIVIGGQTIHSFFQFKPDITPSTVSEIPVRRQKRQMYRELQTVVIDEISMVRADLLDCVDAFLRIHGPKPMEPFGGVQMIFFGDLFQLPPVVSREEGGIFEGVYSSPYFFAAKALSHWPIRVVQLTKIYRQHDEKFINLLNAIRDDEVQPHHWEMLNNRVNAAHTAGHDDLTVTLTTTNAVAESINQKCLLQIPQKMRAFEGVIEGDFDKRALPAPLSLTLKVGAQVMLLNNDAEKRWVNGTLGIVVGIKATSGSSDVLSIRLADGEVVDVKQHTWELYQYYFNEMEKTLSSKTIGFFTQYPIKPAWAVTIHKSQGQTFDRVIIDIGSGTFAHGQIYVALSRCRSLEGIVLKKPLAQKHLLTDERILHFHHLKIHPKAVAA